MRCFLDANVISAAAHWPHGRSRALFRLAGGGRCELVSSEHAISEASRNLMLKSLRGAEALGSLLENLGKVSEGSTLAVKRGKELGLSDNDAPALAAAIAAGADLLITCDRSNYGLLFGTEVEGVRVVSPAEGLYLLLENLAE